MSELESQDLVTVLNLQRVVTLDGVSFLGYSCTPPTPWYVKDFERLDLPGDSPPLLGGARWDHRFNRPSTHGAHLLFGNVRSMQEELAELSPPTGPWVFVCHAPPAESRLDRYYGNLPWGSRAVRATLERHRPFLSLHGHIHESPEVTGAISDRIGETTCVNPGQCRTELLYAEIELDAPKARVLRIEHGRER
jgi:Icc-related predicted phosphoesterase